MFLTILAAIILIILIVAIAIPIAVIETIGWALVVIVGGLFLFFLALVVKIIVYPFVKLKERGMRKKYKED